MTIKSVTEWRKLPVTLTELCIDTTLKCGQSFRWRKINDEWTCTLHGRILSLKQDAQYLHYKTAWPEAAPKPLPVLSPANLKYMDDDDTELLLHHYFTLNLNLAALYEQWSENDTNFRKKAPKFTGIRILSQDAWEALICFICSSNNNIARISQMVHKLCLHYGPLIGYIGDEPLHDFPTAEALSAKNVEAHLRELGFGYRAKYIAETARVVAHEKPAGWLDSLKNPRLAKNPAAKAVKKEEEEEEPVTYKMAHQELLTLAGVGPKVADCVCLMGLGWAESVPVDTHVWQIAQRDYKMGKTKTKTFNKVMYDAVGDLFRSIWGEYAGWAHSVLFTADLRAFSEKGIKREQDSDQAEVASANATPEPKRRKTMNSTKSAVVVKVKKEEGDDESKTTTVDIAAVAITTANRARAKGRSSSKTSSKSIR